MKKNKKILALIIVTAFVTTLFTGCTKQKESNETKNDVKEITAMMPEWGIPSQELLDEFKSESGIDVKVIPTSWDDIKDKVSTAAVGKKVAADVFEVDWAWVGEMQSAGWLEPMELSDTDKKDIPTAKTFEVDGTVYAMPYSNDFRVGYYNQEMYKKAGIEQAPQTWTDVKNNCKILKEKGITDYPLSFSLRAEEKTSTCLYWLTLSNGNTFLKEDNTLNKEAVLESLIYIDDMLKAGYINPKNVNTAGMDVYNQICKGEAAFAVDPSSFVTKINNPEACDVVGQVKPTMVPGKNKKATVTMPLPEAVGISAYSEKKEEAQQFVDWFTSAKTQEKLNKEISLTPTRISVLKKLVESGEIKDAQVMLDEAKIVETPFPSGIPKYYTQMSTKVFNIMNQMGSQKITPQQAVEKMAQEVDTLAKENK